MMGGTVSGMADEEHVPVNNIDAKFWKDFNNAKGESRLLIKVSLWAKNVELKKIMQFKYVPWPDLSPPFIAVTSKSIGRV